MLHNVNVAPALKSSKQNYCEMLLMPFYLCQSNKEERDGFSNVIMDFLTSYHDDKVKQEYMNYLDDTLGLYFFHDIGDNSSGFSPAETRTRLYDLAMSFLDFYDKKGKRKHHIGDSVYSIMKKIEDNRTLQSLFPYANSRDLAICQMITELMTYAEEWECLGE